MEKQDAGPSRRLESCLQHMDRETVDVLIMRERMPAGSVELP